MKWEKKCCKVSKVVAIDSLVCVLENELRVIRKDYDEFSSALNNTEGISTELFFPESFCNTATAAVLRNPSECPE